MKRCQLMLTCLCDAFFGEVGIATVELLAKLGWKAEFPKNQTCCGQPPFNSGDWEHARQAAAHCLSVFNPNLPVVCPSASCTAMVREGYRMMKIEGQRLQVLELSEFLTHQCAIEGGSLNPYPRRVAFHQACHGRSIGLKNEQRSLLELIPELALVPFESEEQCCGFGGAFCVEQPTLSEQIGLEKLRTIEESGAEEIVTGDMGCAMHLKGLLDHQGKSIKIRHFVEILNEVMA